jgi:hypothetical protein
MEVACMSANEWAELIARAVGNKEDPVPRGFKTVMQLCHEQGIPERTLNRKIRLLKENNLIEMKSFRIKKPFGKIMSTPHYRIIKNK